MYLIRLKYYHKEVKNFSHPLLDGAGSVKDYDFADLAKLAVDKEGKEQLSKAMLSVLRYLISLYRGNWPQCEPHLDDMVSEGLKAIAEIVEDPTGNVLKSVSQRIKDNIEIYLNKNQSFAAPSIRTQNYRIKGKRSPLYMETCDIAAEKMAIGDNYKRDVMEALEQLDAKDSVDANILCQDNWGLSDYELAEKCGITRTSIARRRRRLYKDYLKLTR